MLECGIKEVTIETPINGLNLQYRLKTTKKKALKEISEAVEYTKAWCNSKLCVNGRTEPHW
jgi:isopropylmalate/homocitrate/citramalate synthase